MIKEKIDGMKVNMQNPDQERNRILNEHRKTMTPKRP